MTARPLMNQNLGLMQTLDFKCYVFAFSPEEYSKMSKKGTMLSVVATVNGGDPAGFAIWERGPKDHPAYIVRFGVLPQWRLKGIGRQMLGWLLKDLQSVSKQKVRAVLSQNTCRGKQDPDDVSGFMLKTGFKWIDYGEDCFFEYGRYEQGFLFERDVNE